MSQVYYFLQSIIIDYACLWLFSARSNDLLNESREALIMTQLNILKQQTKNGGQQSIMRK